MDSQADIYLKSGILVCGDRFLDLRNRPRAQKLFEAFLARPGQSMSKDQVVEEVYEMSYAGSRSKRFSEALRHNAIKLVSRCRAMAELSFNGEGRRWIDWFVYDPRLQSWKLTKLRIKHDQMNSIDKSFTIAA